MSGDDNSNAEGVGAAQPQMKNFFPDKPLWTPEIERKAEMVAEWVSCELEGSHIWGVQRIGKSEFAKYLLSVMPAMLGAPVAAVMWSFLGVKPRNADEVLKRCLVEMGSVAVATRESNILRTRLIAMVVAHCAAHGARRILIIVDEMQNISHDLYTVLMGVTGDLRTKGLVPHLLSIGQPEMRSTIDLVFQNNHQQIIGRFFQRMEVYSGLSVEDVADLLLNMDGPECEFTRAHFPSRLTQGWSVSQLATPLAQGVEAMLTERNITNARARLPLGYLRPALNRMFRLLTDDDQLVIDAATALDCFRFTRLDKVIGHYVEYEAHAGQ